MTEVATVEIPDATQDAVEVPASQPDCEEAAAEAPPPEGAMATDVPTVEDKVICRRCTSSVQREEAICTPKFREDLRWTCKSCHAVKGQLARHGIELASCLTEDDVVAFLPRFSGGAHEQRGQEAVLLAGQRRAEEEHDSLVIPG